MAIPTVIAATSTRDGSIIRATWNLTTNDPTGIAIESPEWSDRTWYVGVATDTFGGATCTIQGAHTNVEGDFIGLTNASGGAAATFAAQGIKAIAELPEFSRPKLTAVGVGAILTVILVARRANPGRT